MNTEVEGVQDLLVQLTTAVETVMNPLTPHQQRMDAYQACEQFKENSPHCALCGVLMSDKQQNHIIRHFGLQLLEHCVKHRWNSMTGEEKNFIKDKSMKLIQEGTLDILQEQAHIKDALSRVVVEMIKREWPQHWQLLMAELNTLCHLGPTQTELVLMIFLRLAEDIFLFISVPHQRKREIMHALSENMPQLFTYFVDTLHSNLNQYKTASAELSGDPSGSSVSQTTCRVSVAVLNTLAAFLDWINASFISSEKGLVLLEMLCTTLSDTKIQLAAAECLLVIVSRKQKLEDRKPGLVLFEAAPMSAILNSAVGISEVEAVEQQYIFLKKLCQVLVAIGNQLCVLWGACEGVGRPSHFADYLQALEAFSKHPSQTIGSYIHTLLVSFLRHDLIVRDTVFQSSIPRFLETTRNSLVKVGFPSQDNSLSCAFSRLDFDSDEEFSLFFSKYRAEIAETIRQATLAIPEITFQYAAHWLQALLVKPVVTGESRNHCNQSSPAFLEWDALTVCLESVMARMHQSNQPKPPVSAGIQLLKDVLAFESQDALILSSLLSAISALFTFITDAPDILPSVLDKIFSSAVFNLQGQTKATRSKGVKNVRRHACSVLVKICKQYTDLLLPGFDQLYTNIKQLSSDPEQLSHLEKVTLMEALILISNRFMNFQKQCDFLGEVLSPVKQLWLSDEMKQSLWSADKFLSYVGLDQPPVEPSSEDTCGINRSHIMHCINTILAAMKRSVCPEDMEVATRGGFVTGMSETGSPVLRNPATPHILGMLDCVLALLRTFNVLWMPECMSRRHPAFEKSFDMLDPDKQAILGIQPPCIDNTDATSCKHPLERMQSFITNTHQNSFHILGNAGSCLGQEFYQAPCLASSLQNSVFTNLDIIPVFRIRPIIRVFLKPYVQSCPKDYYDRAVMPLLGPFTSYMLQRLTSEWKIISDRTKNSLSGVEDTAEDNPESQEVLDEQVVRQITREYLDFLGTLITAKRTSPAPDEMVQDDEAPVNPSTSKDEGISDLGRLVLNDDNVYPSVVLMLFRAMGWSDSKACSLCCLHAWRITSNLVELQKLTSQDVVHLYHEILIGLQNNGQHENTLASLLSLALHFYEKLRPKYPELVDLMRQVPGCKEESLKSFDDKLLLNSHNSAKTMRDLFKRLTQGVIQKNIGQMYKLDVKIKDLPLLYKAPKPKPRPVDAESGDIGLCALFSPQSQS